MTVKAKSFLRLTAILLAVGFVAVFAYAQSAGTNQGGVLVGEITTINPQAPFSLPGAAGVTVTLEPGGYQAVTNAKGVFRIEAPPGVYTIRLEGPDYEPFESQVTVSATAESSFSASIFPAPKGKPVASLTRGGRTPETGPVPYNTSTGLDASASKNVSRYGIRWEIRDEQGNLVYNPYIPNEPLQLEPSPIPGSSPLSFNFTPPAPGRYTVKLILENEFSAGEVSTAEVTIEAINVAPEAKPAVIAGPYPPTKEPTGQLKISSGATTVVVGEKVFLAARALDRNFHSPELYNPDGRRPDAYGKNDDWYQRQFGWTWQLGYIGADGTVHDLTSQLQDSDGGSGITAQYPWFVAEQEGTYVAVLIAEDRDPHGSLASEPTTLKITALPREKAIVSDEATCLSCHQERAVAGMSCQSCHGPGGPHVGIDGRPGELANIMVSYEAAQCGQCHGEYAEWEKSRHADGYAFGYYEIAQPLLLNCAKCHYPQGFADAVNMAKESQKSFGDVEFKKPMYPNGPLFFDFSKLPEPLGKGISCQTCHNPHQISRENEAGLRLAKAELCGTCHEEKWQNALLEGTAGELGSAYEYPGKTYSRTNPHNTEEKCVLCHMSTVVTEVDANGIRKLGGHTMRMRDAGPDGKLGGFGPAPDNPNAVREGHEADDLLNTAVCLSCHADLSDFNYRGKQAEIYALWQELGTLLKKYNNGILPGYKPGDKCATCHRGGTLPFDNDPHLVLENAYTNYKLVMNDRSWGIHNYEYTLQLLRDSLESLKALER